MLLNEPTPWRSGMVIVPKKSGAVRICVDLTALNKNVPREMHPIPKVDDTLIQLTGPAIFSPERMWLRQVLEWVEAAKVTLTSTKCEFTKTTVKFLGHLQWRMQDFLKGLGGFCFTLCAHDILEAMPTFD